MEGDQRICEPGEGQSWGRGGGGCEEERKLNSSLEGQGRWDREPNRLFQWGLKSSILSRPGFLNLSTMDSLEQINLCWGLS